MEQHRGDGGGGEGGETVAQEVAALEADDVGQGVGVLARRVRGEEASVVSVGQQFGEKRREIDAREQRVSDEARRHAGGQGRVVVVGAVRGGGGGRHPDHAHDARREADVQGSDWESRAATEDGGGGEDSD